MIKRRPEAIKDTIHTLNIQQIIRGEKARDPAAQFLSQMFYFENKTKQKTTSKSILSLISQTRYVSEKLNFMQFIKYIFPQTFIIGAEIYFLGEELGQHMVLHHML